MALLHELPTFFAAVLVISAVPGPAVALLARRAATRGFEATVPVVAGLEAGLYLWIIAAGAGLAALVAASATAYLVLRVAGGAFLVFLGLRAGRAALRGDDDRDLPELPTRSRRGGFVLGVVTNAANPKAAALLGVLQVAFEFVLYCSFVAAVSRTRRWFLGGGTRRLLDALSGSALLGLGAGVAAESR